MRILHVIGSVDLKHGGPIEGLRLSAFELAKTGHVSEIVSLDAPDDPHIGDCGVKTYALGPGSKYLGYTPRLARWIRSNAHNYDAAILHGLWNYSIIGGWAGLRKAKLPYVIYTHGMMDPYFKAVSPLKHLAKSIAWHLVQGKVLRDAYSVLFTCEEERRLARHSFSGFRYNERVVAFGASDAPKDHSSQVAAFASACPDVVGRRYILFLSRIHPKKGCDMLVEAFGRVAAEHAGVDLVMAGPDQVGWREKLEAIAEQAGVADRIHWPGMLVGDAKWGGFSGCDAFILPSHQENFGIVVAEAMACEKPVMITDKVNIWREVEACGGGLVESDTVAGIKKLLRQVLSMSPSQLTNMGNAARSGYETNFSVEGAAQDLLAVLTEATKGTL